MKSFTEIILLPYIFFLNFYYLCSISFKMSPKPLFLKPPLKLKSYKNDLAPIGFFFDIFYFQERIENNVIIIKKNDVLKSEQIFRENKNIYYPQLTLINVNNLKKNKKQRMYFVPYLIYDDIIDIFSNNNKRILHKRIQTPIDILKIWNSNGIINKR